MIASTVEHDVVEVDETATEAVDTPEVTAPEETPVTTEQATKALGKVTLYDECVTRITDVQGDIDESEEVISSLKTRIKNLRERQKADYATLKALNADLRDIKNGQYQRTLFQGLDQPAEKSQPVDPATVTPIENLGMTEKETDLLIAAEIKTISDLESRMRSDNWWHKKIKGFGQAKVDKLSDQLLAWRMKNPMPSEDDDDDVDEDAEELEGMDAFDQEEAADNSETNPAV
jgi:hypothetical protein